MTIILNIFLVLLLLLIAYWWANQGLFSAILHLICVIVAGTIAFGLWEFVTVNFLLRGNAFDDYAWGVSLLSIFTISLVGLRMAFDYGIPANVDLPRWSNLTFGFLVGLCAAILTLGTLFIGAGHMQSHQMLAGYIGYGVSRTTGQIQHLGGRLWIPVHELTDAFYGHLSVGSLHPTFEGQPLRHVNPELDRQLSLLRASYGAGKGKFSLPPDAASVSEFLIDEQNNRHFVTVEFSALARDFGQQLTLARPQVRLICRVPATSQRQPEVVFADAWSQPTANSPWARFSWNEPRQYVSSVPAQDSLRVTFEFPVPSGEVGRFIQIRGTRYELPAPRREAGISPDADRQPDRNRVDVEIGSHNRIDNQIDVTNSIRPILASINRIPGTLRHDDRWLTEGQGTFGRSGDRPARALQIQGIFEPAGTKSVMVDVSRNTPADIFGEVRRQEGGEAAIVLLDAQGNTYPPVGYLHAHREGTTIHLEPRRYLRTADQVPLLPSGAAESLRLIFYVTEGVTITGLRYGNTIVGSASVEAE